MSCLGPITKANFNFRNATEYFDSPQGMENLILRKPDQIQSSIIVQILFTGIVIAGVSVFINLCIDKLDELKTAWMISLAILINGIMIFNIICLVLKLSMVRKLINGDVALDNKYLNKHYTYLIAIEDHERNQRRIKKLSKSQRENLDQRYDNTDEDDYSDDDIGNIE
jgi:hypothetical protein